MPTSPRVMVVFPAPESPTTPRIIGRGMHPSCVAALASTPFRSRVAGRFLLGVVEHRALEDVVGLERDEVLLRELSPRLEQPGGLSHPGSLDRVADAATVGKAWLLEPQLDVVAHRTRA